MEKDIPKLLEDFSAKIKEARLIQEDIKKAIDILPKDNIRLNFDNLFDFNLSDKDGINKSNWEVALKALNIKGIVIEK